MVRVSDIDASLKFYCEGLGLSELRRYESEEGRFTLVFLGPPKMVAKGSNMRADVISDIWRIALKIFMRRASGLRAWALRSIARPAMDVWPLCDRRMELVLSFCSAARHLPLMITGSFAKILGSGSDLLFDKFKIMTCAAFAKSLGFIARA